MRKKKTYKNNFISLTLNNFSDKNMFIKEKVYPELLNKVSKI